MPQIQNEKRETAKQIYVDCGGKITMRELAQQLETPQSTVSTWKRVGKWDSLLKHKPRKMRPGSKGNQRAAKPHPSVKGNKSALKTGRFETIKYATMTPDEKAIMDEVRQRTDQIKMQLDIIGELEVREARMYARIESLRQKSQEDKARDGMVTESASYTQKGTGTKGTSATRNRRLVEDKILEIENALTAIQKQKQSALMGLHKLTEDQISRQIERERMDMERQRVDLMERRLNLVDPNAETDAMQEARELLGGIKSAF